MASEVSKWWPWPSIKPDSHDMIMAYEVWDDALEPLISHHETQMKAKDAEIKLLKAQLRHFPTELRFTRDQIAKQARVIEKLEEQRNVLVEESVRNENSGITEKRMWELIDTAIKRLRTEIEAIEKAEVKESEVSPTVAK